MKLIENEFGTMPISVAQDRRTRGKFKAWRDSMADRPRVADYAWTVLARVLSVAKDNSAITVNVCERGGRLYESDRAEITCDAEASASADTATVAFIISLPPKRSADAARKHTEAPGAVRLAPAPAKPPIAAERVVDTLVLARRKHPGGHNTLDDLCARYGVDRSRRSKHGALLDAELLAAVYVELTTTRQAALQLEPLTRAPSNIQAIVRARPKPLPPRVPSDDRNAHRSFVHTLGGKAIWLDYFTIRSVAA